MGFKSDIEIAQEAKPLDIREVGKKLGLTEDDLELYGKYKAKVDYNLLKKDTGKPKAKLILTTAINRLIKKEYVERRRIEEDRRVVLIKLTEKGDEAFKSHADFHDDMIKSIMKELPKDEEEILITALKKMVNFFEEKYNLKK